MCSKGTTCIEGTITTTVKCIVIPELIGSARCSILAGIAIGVHVGLRGLIRNGGVHYYQNGNMVVLLLSYSQWDRYPGYR